MKKIFSFFMLMLICCSVSKAQNIGPAKGAIMLMLGDDRDPASLHAEMAYLNGEKTEFHLKRILSISMHIYLFEFNSLAPHQQVLNAVRKLSFVKAAQLDLPVSSRVLPNDPEFSYLWNMHNTGLNNGIAGADIDALNAWDLATGGLTAEGDTIVVAVIDNGFDLTHEDLTYWRNRREIPGNGLDDDQNGYIDDYAGWNSKDENDKLPIMDHGTHVCGIAGAKGNNGIGITGVNWNLQLLPVSYGSGTGFESNVIAAYAYVLDQRKLYNNSKGAKGAFIVASNSSFGIDTAKAADHPLWCMMYDSLGAAGVLSAGATSNYRELNVDVEGDIPTTCSSNWLITVTNTTNRDEKDSGAAYGPVSIDLGAPGTNIASTVPISGYSFLSGTSMSTPHVAGAVALMYSAACPAFIKQCKTNPAAMALLVKDSLLHAVDVTPALNGKTVSGGRLNLFKSLQSIKKYCGEEELPAYDLPFHILNVYPVPAVDQLTIDYTSDVMADLFMTSVLGQDILRVPCARSDNGIIQHMQINLTGISKGIYFITLRSPNKKTKSIKVVL